MSNTSRQELLTYAQYIQYRSSKDSIHYRIIKTGNNKWYIFKLSAMGNNAFLKTNNEFNDNNEIPVRYFDSLEEAFAALRNFATPAIVLP